MFEKFDAEHSDNEAHESGDENAAQQRSTRTTVTSLRGLSGEDEDGEEDDGLSTYNSSTIRRSIEDDGNYQTAGSKPLDMTQAWSFTNLEDDPRPGSGSGSGEADCGSDDAQFDSSGDDRGRALSEQDTDMAPAGPFEGSTSWDNQGVLSELGDGTKDDPSDPVTEIHLEGDKTARSD